MGQSISILCPMTWNLSRFGEFFESIARDQAAEFSAFDDQLQVVAKGLQWKLIVREASDQTAVAEEYASNDDLDTRFRGEVHALHCFTIMFDNVDMTRKLVRAIADAAVNGSATVWIDTDYGWVIHARDFLKRTDQDPGWDWRTAQSAG
jgi:hypothetical protein